MNLAESTILVTGGGSGIGRELARALHDEGARVIVAGRRPAPLEETIAGRARMDFRLLDVADPGAIERFARQIGGDQPGLNILINNAGIMRPEDLRARADVADAEAMVATNLLAPIRLTHALLPQLLRQPSSAIINVTSGLAFVPLTRTPTYNATKAALHSYTIALREQLRGTPVEVFEIIPPAVQTELTPGQSTMDGYMPLDDFIAETMALLRKPAANGEIAVERVAFLRNAEAEHRFDQTLAALNGPR